MGDAWALCLSLLVSAAPVLDALVVQSAVPSAAHKPHAVMFTPYHLTTGGGEKYLLEFGLSMQNAGYTVELLTVKGNACETMGCVADLVNMLRVPISLSPDVFSFQLLTYDEIIFLHTNKIETHADVYFELGNSKVPQFPNFGKVGIYMCQFPFDLEKPVTQEELDNLATFDKIFVNSVYTRGWYTHFMDDTYSQLTREGARWPSVEIVYPAVEAVAGKTGSAISSFEVEKNPRRIVMLGRIFSGRQNKGHSIAIDVMDTLTKTPGYEDVELHVIGKVQPGFEPYADGLKANATKKDARVFFHFDAPVHQLHTILGTSSFQWHLTGLEDDEAEDPANQEHFGIAIIECMLAGIIPIVTGIGGGPEILFESGAEQLPSWDRGWGSIGKSVHNRGELLEATKELMSMPVNELEQMKAAAFKRAKAFSRNVFHGEVQANLDVATHSQEFYKQLPRLPYTCSSVPDDTDVPIEGAAAIVVHSPQHQLQMVIQNVMGMLGPGWKLHIWAAKAADAFVKRIFSGNAAIKFHVVPHSRSLDAYSDLLMSKEFWTTFESDQVLIFESDAALIQRGVEKFRALSYVGAPWCEDNELFIDKEFAMPRVGNGGLSIRSKSEMLSCIDDPQAQSYAQHAFSARRKHGGSQRKDGIINEDVFFAVCASQRDQLPSKEIATRFSVEVPCNKTELLENPPVGIHKTFQYMSPTDFEHFIGESMKRFRDEEVRQNNEDPCSRACEC